MKGYTVIGRLASPKGTSGHLKALLETDKEGFDHIEAFFIEDSNGLPLPCFIESIDWEPDHALIKFEEVSSKEEAYELAGRVLYLPSEMVEEGPPETEGNYGYLSGYEICDEQNGVLGKIEEVLQMPGQELALLYFHDRELLVPLNEDLILNIDKKQQRVDMRLPDGLLDLYLDED